ncbi:MAG: hypothetical protein HOW97_15430 [Catenulispora sp.]|nr:hypothetical protein [Catenulispora sp.]
MVRIPNPLDALGALAAIPASLGITALLKLAAPTAGTTIYGLAERGPLVSVDGFDADGLRELSAIALAHGDAVDPAAPLLVVATDLFPERHPDAARELRRVAATLAHRDRVLVSGRIWELDEAPAQIPGRAEWAEAQVAMVLGDGDPRPETALILRSSTPAIAAADTGDEAVPVEQPAATVSAAVLTGHWAVSTVTPKARVTVSGRGPCPDRIVLAAVTDLGPYVSGARSRALRLAKRTFS